MADDIPFNTAPVPQASETRPRTVLSCMGYRDDRTPKVSAKTPAQFIAQLESAMLRFLRQPHLPETINDLVGLGLENDLADMLRKLVKEGHNELKLVVAFVYALSESPIGHLFGRSVKRAILKGWKDAVPDALLNQLMQRELKELDSDCWGHVGDDVLRYGASVSIE